MRKATTAKTVTKPPKATTPKAKTASVPPLSHGVGRRKKAIARIWLKRGRGNVIVNGKDYREYFDTSITQNIAVTAFRILSLNVYDVEANVSGGGLTGQADAIKLGIARALSASDESYKKKLRDNGLLTVDARVKERKKYGQKAARRKFQFVKR